MTGAGKNIVEDFVSLSDPEKREVLANLLRISVRIDYPQMSEEELLASADAVSVNTTDEKQTIEPAKTWRGLARGPRHDS